MGGTIALLTDFGIQDTYVGVMKGVMRGICRDAQLLDLTHTIQPQNIREAALALLTTYSYFRAETVFLVVVDPGVGSERRPIAVSAGGYFFVAPDNGVLSYTLNELEVNDRVTLSNAQYHRQPVSRTFHGRDIFSPAAAHLANGVALSALGDPARELVTLPAPLLRVADDVLTGEVIHIDHFGNAVTSIGVLTWADSRTLKLSPRWGDTSATLEVDSETVTVEVNDRRWQGIQPTYSETTAGDGLALVGSSGFLELAVNQGSYAAMYEVRVGDEVKVRR